MSNPYKNYGESTIDKLMGALNELTAARSALNMEPMPMTPDPNLNYPSNAFLSQTDFWVNHSMIHLDEVYLLVMEAVKKVNEDNDKKVMESLKRMIGE
jgi:hypothetical protein